MSGLNGKLARRPTPHREWVLNHRFGRSEAYCESESILNFCWVYKVFWEIGRTKKGHAP